MVQNEESSTNLRHRGVESTSSGRVDAPIPTCEAASAPSAALDPSFAPQLIDLRHAIHDALASVPPTVDNNLKRQLYSRLELLRMDYLAQPGPAAYIKQRESILMSLPRSSSRKAAAPKVEVPGTDPQVLATIAEFDSLRASLAMRGEPASATVMLRVFIYALLFNIFSLPICYLLTPLRLLHPPLRLVGIPNNYLPIDLLHKFYAAGWCVFCGVEVVWTGLHNVDLNKPTIAMFSHVSNVDAAIYASGRQAFKWVGKRVVFLVPLIGWLLWLWGHIPIDRTNLDKAKQALARAVQSVHRYKRSVAIAPEGMRSRTGRLGDFKKGPFHVAAAVGLPITPMLVFGAFELWPPSCLFLRPGRVLVRVLPQIPVDANADHNELLLRVRRVMLEGYGQPVPDMSSLPVQRTPLTVLCFWLACYAVAALLYGSLFVAARWTGVL